MQSAIDNSVEVEAGASEQEETGAGSNEQQQKTGAGSDERASDGSGEPDDHDFARLRHILSDLSIELNSMSEDMVEFGDKVSKVIDTFARKV